MSISFIAPVIASKPVAKTIASSAYSASSVRNPAGVISWIGLLLISTKVTLSILGFVRALLVGRHRNVARGQAEIGRPLEDVKVLRLPCDDGNRLDAGRAGADHAHPQSAEIDPFMGP